MSAFPNMSHFPKLEEWYESASSSAAKDLKVVFLREMAHSFSLSPAELGLRHWMRHLALFIDSAQGDPQVFLDFEEQCYAFDIDFMKIACDVAEFAIRHERGHDFLNLMQSVADKTDLQVFRFLAAWTALNTHQLQLCIDECEKIETPFACVYTLQGQAYLERGDLAMAQDSLKLALALAPADMMTLFQLAKVYYLRDETQLAWATLCQCEQIQAHHPEVDSFKTVVALKHTDEVEQRDWLRLMVPVMLQHLGQEPANAAMLHLLFEVQLALSDEEGMQQMLAIADWRQLKRDPDFMGGLADILRLLDQKGWRSVSAQMLTTLTT